MSESQRRVEGCWQGGLRCDVAMDEFSVIVDEPVSIGGTNKGPQPTDLFLASIASCFTLAIAYSAQKKSIELQDLSVAVTGTYEGTRFSRIEIDSRLYCDEPDISSLIRAAENICYVTNSLRSGIDIKISASKPS